MSNLFPGRRFVVNGEGYFFVPRVICWLGGIYVLLLERVDFAGKIYSLSELSP